MHLDVVASAFHVVFFFWARRPSEVSQTGIHVVGVEKRARSVRFVRQVFGLSCDVMCFHVMSCYVTSCHVTAFML